MELGAPSQKENGANVGQELRWRVTTRPLSKGEPLAGGESEAQSHIDHGTRPGSPLPSRGTVGPSFSRASSVSIAMMHRTGHAIHVQHIFMILIMREVRENWKPRNFSEVMARF